MMMMALNPTDLLPLKTLQLYETMALQTPLRHPGTVLNYLKAAWTDPRRSHNSPKKHSIPYIAVFNSIYLKNVEDLKQQNKCLKDPLSKPQPHLERNIKPSLDNDAFLK